MNDVTQMIDAHRELVTKLAETQIELRAARRLLAEVRACGIEFDDPRVRYLTVQIDRELWEQL